MTDREGLEGALTAVLKSDDTRQLVAEYAEIGIDALFKDSVAKEIPIIGTILGIAKAGLTVRDRLFSRKLLELMRPFADVDSSQREEMIAKLERDPKYGRKVGEHLIEIVDRIELHRKPPMISAIFLAYQRGNIDAIMLHRLHHAVEKIPTFEINALRPFCQATPEKREAPLVTLQNLQASGLLNSQSAWGGMVFQPNEVSEAFLMLGLDELK
jgi:hypothetical protein